MRDVATHLIDLLGAFNCDCAEACNGSASAASARTTLRKKVSS